MTTAKRPIGNFYEDWKILRQHKIKYFLIRSTFLYGVPVWVLVLLITWAFDIELYGDNAHIYLILFCIAGYGYTLLEWKYNERKYLKREKEERGKGDGDS